MAVPPPIPLSVPELCGSEQRYVSLALEQNLISTTGPSVEALEHDFSALIGLPVAALASGSAAVHLGLRALGVGPGDEVLAPTLAPAAAVNPVTYLGARPAFIDSEQHSWNLDPQRLEDFLRSRAQQGRLPKACIVVHLYGQSADLDAILSACGRYEVRVLEDASEALGAYYKGRPVGTFAEVGAWSLGANKVITSGTGGVLCAKDPALIERVRSWSQQAADPAQKGQHSEVGYTCRLSNVLAGIGRGQLQMLATRVQQRRAIAARYRAAFDGTPGLAPLPQAVWGTNTNWLSVFTVDERAFGLSRDGLLRAVAAAGIEARPVWTPLHQQPLFAGAPCEGGEVAVELAARGLCLPSSSSLSTQDQARVIAAVLGAARRG